MGRAPIISFADAPPAPVGLIFLATFSTKERAEIATCSHLTSAIRAASAAEWPVLIRRHREGKYAAALKRVAALRADNDGMRRQAIDDLKRAADTLAALSDNRRGQLFVLACRLARYVANDVLSEAEICNALRGAASANGSLTRYGYRWADNTVKRALIAGRNDALPMLARRFRTKGARP